MGMQLNRGILPESIDTFINAEIGELVQQELLANAHTVLQENVNLQSMTMSPINLFRTLYRKDEIPIRYVVYTYDVSDGIVTTEGIKGYVDYVAESGYYKIYIPNNTNVGDSSLQYPVNPNDDSAGNKATNWCNTKVVSNVTLFSERKPINPMLYLGVNIATKTQRPGQYTSCRLIGADTLETTLRDFCNGADKNNPIATLLGESRDILKANGSNYIYDKTINAEYFEIYTNTKGFEIDRIYLSYIKYPNIVRWSTNPEDRIDCDLPEYIHYRIVEGAVRRFLIAIGNGISQESNK